MSPLPAPPYRPTGDLVAVAWLAAYVPELTAAMVGTALPHDVTKWLDTGFLQATTIPGGRVPEVDLPRRLPVVQLDAWATAMPSGTSSSIKPPWNLAGQLIEHVRVATEDAQTGRYGKRLVVKANYLDVRVQAVYLLSEPAKVTDDPSGYARFTADLAVDWVPA